MNRMAFSIKNLKLSYNDNVVIKDLSCEIKENKITYIIGGNGAGKSTLIKALIGNIKPNKGSIKLYDSPLSAENIAEHVGYVPQYATIDRSFPITVAEMIALECGHQKNCKIGTYGHLKVFRAEELMNKKISDLSGGELQKALIARALVTDPDILILDEPFNNLDHDTEFDLIELLRNLQAEQGKTIIFVTHDLSIINLENSDAIYLTHGEGKIGKAHAVISEHKLAKI